MRLRARATAWPGWLLAALVLAATAAALVFHATADALPATPDGLAYFGAASNLSSGRGLTVPFQEFAGTRAAAAIARRGHQPLTDFPPLYPTAIGSLEAVGIPGRTSARAIGLVCAALVVLLIGAIAARLVAGSAVIARTVITTLVIVAAVTGPSGPPTRVGPVHDPFTPLNQAAHIASEPLFYVLVLAALACCIVFLQRPKTAWLLGMCAFGALTALTRYEGIAVIPAMAVAVVVCAPQPRQTRLAGAALIVAIGAAVAGAWQVVNQAAYGAAAARTAAYHPDPHFVGRVMLVISRWFFPAAWPTAVAQPVSALLVATAVVAGLWLGARRHRTATDAALFLLAVYVPLQVSLLVVTRTWFDATLSLDQRILGPVQMSLCLLMTGLIFRAIRAVTVAARAPAVRGAVLAVRGAALAPAVTIAALAAIVGPNAVVIVRSLPWRTVTLKAPPEIAAVEDLPSGAVVVSDEPWTIWQFTGRPAVLGPVPDFAKTGRANPHYERDAAALGAAIRSSGGVFVDCSLPTPSPHPPTPRQLAETMGLHLAPDLEGGCSLLRP